MGARTDQAERRVAEQRARITRMLGDLERRVGDDVEGVRNNVAERASDIGGRASSMKDNVTGHVPGGDMLSQQLTSHPLVSVLGGFGTGVALGMASTAIGGDDGAPDRGKSREPARGSRRDLMGGGSHMLDMLTAQAMTIMAGPIRDEMQTMARQALAGFLGNDKGSAGETPREKPGDERGRSSGPRGDESSSAPSSRNGHEPAAAMRR